MKRLILALCVTLGLTGSAFAQPVAILDTGSITAVSSGGACSAAPAGCAVFLLPNAIINSVTLQVSGTFSATLAFEATSDGTNWNAITGTKLSDGSSASTATAVGQFAFPNSGIVGIRVRATGFVSGTVTVTAVRGYALARWLTPFFSTVSAGDGTCAAPAYSFTSDATQGLAKGCLTLAQGTLAADAQVLSTTATWNNAAIAFTHMKAVITDTASAAGSLALSIKGGAAGATTLFSVDKTGSGTFGATTTVAAAAGWGIAGRGYWFAPSDGVFTIYNAATTDFSRLQFGGTTTSFGAIARSGAGFKFVLADNSANTFTTASFYNSSTISALTVTTNTIAPTSAIHQLGAGLIKTITVPAGCTPTCTLYLEPTAAFTYDATGNILVPSGGGTAVISKLMVLIWNGTKWVPSY